MAAAGGFQCIKYLLFIFNFIFWVGIFSSLHEYMLIQMCL